ncbi:MAG: TIGR00300 family protein [Phycisphaerae bacterium]
MFSEEITLEGHIIDWPVLTRVLDDINSSGGAFKVLEMQIGRSREERSHAVLEVSASTEAELDALLAKLRDEGALVRSPADARLVDADVDGAFPEEFYSSTNQQTFIRAQGHWHEVQNQEMDCGIVLDRTAGTFRCVPVAHVKRGQPVVCGRQGIKVVSLARQRESAVFEFMASEISSEKPKNAIIRNCAAQMLRCKQDGKKLLLVGGPAIVHTGASEHVVRLIERGYFHVLFAGNALATHDIEQHLFGTSLGVYIDKATSAAAGHEHHLRAINRIRRAGGIRPAIEQGIVSGGIMHACVKHGVRYVLAGSIRDDGPLPDVITDAVAAQDAMRAAIGGVGFVLMIATALHSIATGNLLPAWVPCVCVDISPSFLTKLSDRGSFQTIGLVTDVEPFFRELLHELELLESAAKK